ncbi:alpha-ketoglutarate-dependent dioxygenase AlkB [Caulobacter sp. 17J80-11]|uniref:alpha-ketoglutarate-dependent dioxygenase AlkB n=1 Tax=Caulobacter sp. 17J80-11 TaxID=2763502 RepID=UPI00165347E6|nr:alpha-ketoglutarate-dependent dioxygenase AlkB [Caulobacter sp. 17J80-11]MBC6983508.1 alpha-ketoglutarate-dependent dioxygenase AlkB [Caulobacter sp. 17J80-11]
MASTQPGLFQLTPSPPALPEGFVYRPEVLTPDEEARLAARLAELAFAPFEFRGYLGKRQVVSFGWRYDFTAGGLRPAAPIPDFLKPLRVRAAEAAGLTAADLQQALVTQYPPGAAIGWHKDRPEFAEVVGVSLLAPGLLRFRRPGGRGWERASLTVEPRSLYVLAGPARYAWEHSLPPVGGLRYSITFRRLRGDAGGRVAGSP